MAAIGLLDSPRQDSGMEGECDNHYFCSNAIEETYPSQQFNILPCVSFFLLENNNDNNNINTLYITHNQALCAIATTAALLNSLRDVGPQFELPMDPTYKPFLWATQANILGSAETDSCVVEALGGSIYNRDAVYHMGLGLTMVPRLANCFLAPNGYEATAHPGVASEEASIKAIVLEALRDPSKRVIYNYDRGGIGQGPMGHGHWSPLGGYHEATDSFLVMDVAKYKHPMVWVPWDNLWSGATTVDSCGETLELDEVVDWSLGYSRLIGYLSSRCIPGNRGFVVVQPTDGEL